MHLMGHAKRKPTTLATNALELMQLNEIRGAPSNEAELPGQFRSMDLAQRMEISKTWSTWAPGLTLAIVTVVQQPAQMLDQERVSKYGAPKVDPTAVPSLCIEKPCGSNRLKSKIGLQQNSSTRDTCMGPNLLHHDHSWLARNNQKNIFQCNHFHIIHCNHLGIERKPQWVIFQVMCNINNINNPRCKPWVQLLSSNGKRFSQ